MMERWIEGEDTMSRCPRYGDKVRAGRPEGRCGDGAGGGEGGPRPALSFSDSDERMKHVGRSGRIGLTGWEAEGGRMGAYCG
jgi:hypothetical protein